MRGAGFAPAGATIFSVTRQKIWKKNEPKRDAFAPLAVMRKNHRANADPRFFRPLRLARLASSATGGARLAPPSLETPCRLKRESVFDYLLGSLLAAELLRSEAKNMPPACFLNAPTPQGAAAAVVVGDGVLDVPLSHFGPSGRPAPTTFPLITSASAPVKRGGADVDAETVRQRTKQICSAPEGGGQGGGALFKHLPLAVLFSPLFCPHRKVEPPEGKRYFIAFPLRECYNFHV